MDLNITSGLFGLIQLALVIYAVLQIAESAVPTSRKVLWILLVFFFPLLGFIIWWFAGPRK